MQRLILGAAGTLTHTPERPLEVDAPAAWVLEDLDEPRSSPGRVLVSGSAELGPGLTLSSTAGWSTGQPKRIPVDSLGTAAPGPYFLAAPTGVGELVWVDGVDVEASALVARAELLENYPTGSSVRPLTLEAPVPEAITGDEARLGAPLRVVWSYEFGGAPRVHQELVAVVRHTTTDAATADVIEFARVYFPDLPAQRRREGEELGWAKLARRLVEVELRGVNIDPAKLLAGDRSTVLVGYRMLMIAADNGLFPGTSELRAFRDAVSAGYRQAFDRLTVGGAGVEAVDLEGDRAKTIERPGLDVGW